MIAELSSDTFASVVNSTIAVHVSSPVLALCRKLIEAGHPSSASLDIYRGETLSLHVRSIGEAARLRMGTTATGRPIFKADETMPPAPPMGLNEPGATLLSSAAA
jgi:hypothetical protein